MNTPMDWLAARVSVERKALQTAALASLVAAVLIMVGGGIVRVTGSGLGCPDWPTCVDGAIGPTPAMGLHGVIEFANRLLTTVLCVVVGWVILAARLQRVPAANVTKWAWVQFWVVVLNAMVGGATVLAELNPYVVAAHFLAATILLTTAAITWDKVELLDQVQVPQPPLTGKRLLGCAFLVGTSILIVLGTVVTGTGPHAGDSADVPRMQFSWELVTIIHSVCASAVFIVAAMIWTRARSTANKRVAQRAGLFLIVLIAQGAVGIIQILTNLPGLVVVLHILGSAVVWVGAVRVLLALRLGTETLPIGKDSKNLREMHAE